MAEKELKKETLFEYRHNGEKKHLRMPKELKEHLKNISKKLGVTMLEALALIVEKTENDMNEQDRNSLARQQATDDASELIRQHNRIAYSFDHLLERLYDSFARQSIFDGREDYVGFRSQIDVWLRLFDTYSDADKKKYKVYIKKVRDMRKNPRMFFEMWGRYSTFVALKKKAMVHGHVQGMNMIESTMKNISKKRNDASTEIEFKNDKTNYENNVSEEE